LGPRLCGANAARSPTSRWRLQVFKDDEHTPSRRINAPISPGLAQLAPEAAGNIYSSSQARINRNTSIDFIYQDSTPR
jgi:hypothetical protein